MQPELFEWSSQSVHQEQPASKATFLERNFVTVRLDQAIGLSLILLVFFVLIFSWGVEKGKKSAMEIQASKAALVEAALPVAQVPVVAEIKPQVTISEENTAVPKEVSIPVAELPQPIAKVTLPKGKFTIQHVTYVTQSAADREIQKLAKMGYSSFVIPSGKHLQVCIEAFQMRPDASRLLRQLRSKGVVSGDAYIRPIPA